MCLDQVLYSENRTLCFVLTNSDILNLSPVWIRFYTVRSDAWQSTPQHVTCRWLLVAIIKHCPSSPIDGDGNLSPTPPTHVPLVWDHGLIVVPLQHLFLSDAACVLAWACMYNYSLPAQGSAILGWELRLSYCRPVPVLLLLLFLCCCFCCFFVCLFFR